MIVGSINRNGELIVPLRMLDANGHLHRFDAMIDTGFNGDVAMPLLQIRELALTPDDAVVVTMANDESELFDTYHGSVIWDGQRLPVQVIATEGRLLIGTDLLWGSLLSAEITEHGAVTISPLPSSDGSSSAGSAPGGSPAPVSPE